MFRARLVGPWEKHTHGARPYNSLQVALEAAIRRECYLVCAACPNGEGERTLLPGATTWWLDELGKAERCERCGGPLDRLEGPPGRRPVSGPYDKLVRAVMNAA